MRVDTLRAEAWVRCTHGAAGRVDLALVDVETSEEVAVALGAVLADEGYAALEALLGEWLAPQGLRLGTECAPAGETQVSPDGTLCDHVVWTVADA